MKPTKSSMAAIILGDGASSGNGGTPLVCCRRKTHALRPRGTLLSPHLDGPLMAEAALLSLRPTRLASIHLYFFAALLWFLAVLAFLNVYNVIPDWDVGIRLKSAAAALLGFLGLLFVLFAEVKRLATRYLLTDSRIVRRDGILRRRTQEMPLNKIERVEVDEGIVQRILRFGDVVIDTGEDSVTFASVRNVRSIESEISKRIAAVAR